jgi:hypothetical protein
VVQRGRWRPIALYCDEKDRQLGDGGRQISQQRQRIGIGELQIFERQHAYAACQCQQQPQYSFAQQQHRIHSRFRRAGRRPARQYPAQGGAERPQLGRLGQPARAQRRHQRLGERPVRPTTGHCPSSEHRRPSRAGVPGEVGQQGALADAGFTADQDSAALTLLSRSQPVP